MNTVMSANVTLARLVNMGVSPAKLLCKACPRRDSGCHPQSPFGQMRRGPPRGSSVGWFSVIRSLSI